MNYTSIKQSKKLLELGLSPESADMYYMNSTKLVMVIPNYETDFLNLQQEDDIPCWSLAALLRLMPFQIIENNNRFGFYQIKGFDKQGETYRFGYKTNNNFFLFETSWYNDSVDAAFEMICWLKENNKL